LGNTRLISNTSGAVQASYTYDAYGNLLGKTGTVANPFGYAGQYTDSESGLIYLRARYYDPSTAQFTSRDPLVAFTHEPYVYVYDNPLNGAGRTGLLPSLQQIWTAVTTFVEQVVTNDSQSHSPYKWGWGEMQCLSLPLKVGWVLLSAPSPLAAVLLRLRRSQ
jgi:RHS repeat-associated protein